MSLRLIGSILAVLVVLGSGFQGGWLAAAENDKSTPAVDAAAGWKLLYSEDFSSSASPDWHLNHGTWKTVDGAWQGAEEPADKHAAAARHEFKFDDAVLELDFKFDGAKMVSLSINDAKNHLCRVQILPDRFRVAKDDHDGPKGPDKGQVLGEKQIELKPGAWHHIRVEFKGPLMTAQIDDASAGGEHAQIALPKANLGLVVGGQTASFRNLRLSVPAK
jgi:hypothetical protein